MQKVFLVTLALVFALLVCDVIQPNPTVRAKELVRLDEIQVHEASQLMRHLLVAVDPNAPTSHFIPPFVRQKLTGLFSRFKSEELVLNLSPIPCRDKGGENVLMKSAWLPEWKKLGVEVYAPKLLEISGGRFTAKLRNTFAIGLAHESIHLENTREHFVSGSAQDRYQDEVRAWLVTILRMVRPMREAGQELDIFWLAADDVLGNCGDSPACPEFQGFIAPRANTHAQR